ncbi:hypothetical protein LWF01_08745 [Saxibacter everestensis]|uniref:DUF2470 domain-containing protein n=1 Tax=Saxibacter everestensis TaxID=2909229 RepID=A0ABY8QXR5_9MICO|nr:hypothetical protein LWF01_08745 [Brevibacteriaceae bacterium ZFBP1038]
MSGIGTAVLTSARTPVSIPVLHAEAQDGKTILVADAESLAAVKINLPHIGTSYSDIPALLQIRSLAPIEQLSVTRAITLISGTLASLPAHYVSTALRARCSGLRLGEVVGHRAASRLLTFTPESCDVLIGDEYSELPIGDILAATPDPLAHEEQAILLDVVDQTAGQWEGFLELKGTARGSKDAADAGSVPLRNIASARPIGIDRHGLTLICHWFDREPATLRVPFPQPVRDGGEALDAVRFLLMAHQVAASSG